MTQELPLTTEQQHLVEDNLALVEKVAGMVHAQAPTFELGELVAFGYEGLVEAAQRFDPSHGVQFADFAFFRVRGSIWDGIRSSSQFSRSDQQRYTAEQMVEACRNRREALTGTMERLALLVAKSGPAPRRTSLADAAEVPLGGPSPETQVNTLRIRDRILEATQALETAEREILRGHYFDDKTLEQAGAAVGLSKSWTSRLHARALKLLGKALKDIEPR